MTETLPLFPLNTVLFPHALVPLHVFEDRYRALVHALLRYDDPADRRFGSVAIREGYEVGETGRRSLHRVGCLLQLVESDAHADGTFDIVARGLSRLRLDEVETSGPYPAGRIELLPDEEDDADAGLVDAALTAFDDYRALISQVRGESVMEGDLTRDPGTLSCVLASTVLLPLRERQELLETAGVGDRLRLVTRHLRTEVRTMTAMPSLPAAQVARTGWCPN